MTAADRSRQAQAKTQGCEAEVPPKASHVTADGSLPALGPDLEQVEPSSEGRGGVVDEPPAPRRLGAELNKAAQPELESDDFSDRLAKLDSLVRDFSKDVDGFCGRRPC